MAFRDFFSRGERKQTLPRGAKLVRRRRRNGGSDVGYWTTQNTWILLDGTTYDSYAYLDSTGEPLSTSVARVELERNGYEHDSYTAPVGTPSTSYSYDSDSSHDSGRSSYDSSGSGGSTGYSSYDSGSSGGSSYDSGSSYSSGGSSYDSGSSYSSGSSSSSSSYDSGSSSSSSDW